MSASCSLVFPVAVAHILRILFPILLDVCRGHGGVGVIVIASLLGIFRLVRKMLGLLHGLLRSGIKDRAALINIAQVLVLVI